MSEVERAREASSAWCERTDKRVASYKTGLNHRGVACRALMLWGRIFGYTERTHRSLFNRLCKRGCIGKHKSLHQEEPICTTVIMPLNESFYVVPCSPVTRRLLRIDLNHCAYLYFSFHFTIGFIFIIYMIESSEERLPRLQSRSDLVFYKLKHQIRAFS